jgi:hypothetical protein
MEITGTQEHVTDLLLGQFVVVKGLPKCLGAHQLCTTQYQLKKGTLNGKRLFSPKQEEAFQAYRSFILQSDQVSCCWFIIIIKSCKDIFPNSH